MARKTIAQLEAENQALKAELAKAKKVYYRGNFWRNDERRDDNDPEWKGNLRIGCSCSECGHSKPLWLDTSMWQADPERFDENPPEFSISVSRMRDEYIATAEAKYQAARAKWLERKNAA